jgi:proline iminopeptidase
MMKNLLFILLLFSSATHSQTKNTIVNGDAKIHFRTFGNGKPMLIINGGPGMNSDGFATLAEKLSKDNQTIIYDQRGTGKSTLKRIDASTITMDLMVADIEALRKHLKIEKWIVLGHSFGGMLASYYATKHPENIDRLILSSSGGHDLALRSNTTSRMNDKLTETEKDSLAYWNEKINQGDTSYKARIGRGRAMASAYVYDKKNTAIIAERLTQGNAEINNLLWKNMTDIKFDCAPKLTTFHRPVLIIQGKDDILDLSIAENDHKIFKNSKLVLLDKCGHYGWLDTPDAYFSAIHNFLNDI